MLRSTGYGTLTGVGVLPQLNRVLWRATEYLLFLHRASWRASEYLRNWIKHFDARQSALWQKRRCIRKCNSSFPIVACFSTFVDVQLSAGNCAPMFVEGQDPKEGCPPTFVRGYAKVKNCFSVFVNPISIANSSSDKFVHKRGHSGINIWHFCSGRGNFGTVPVLAQRLQIVGCRQ